ncbi:MAG: histidine kinase [Trichormus sp. ATA11-4-KO1]|jgi:hypothetical protein|nr:histidine kinase [Trichormus sp. ATA11-4-KO1]
MQLRLDKLVTLKYFKYKSLLASVSVLTLLVITFLLKANLSNSRRTETWNNAKEITSPFLLKKALSFNSTGRIDSKSIKVMPVPSQGGGNLYIFDFRSPQLCGIGGCLYLVYHESGKLVFSLIAHQNLPPKEEVIRTSDTIANEFPCLVVTQPTANENIVSRTDYCYQGEGFIRFNQVFSVAK